MLFDNHQCDVMRDSFLFHIKNSTSSQNFLLMTSNNQMTKHPLIMNQSKLQLTLKYMFLLHIIHVNWDFNVHFTQITQYLQLQNFIEI